MSEDCQGNEHFINFFKIKQINRCESLKFRWKKSNKNSLEDGYLI